MPGETQANPLGTGDERSPLAGGSFSHLPISAILFRTACIEMDKIAERTIVSYITRLVS